MKSQKISHIVVVSILINVATNMVHPVTPTYIEVLGLPSYMFGVLFAAMSIGNFLLSPLWGQLSDRYGRLPVISISLIGYALFQVLFGYAQNGVQAVIWRFLGGSMICGSTVACMAYVVHVSGNERAKYLSYYAAAVSLSGAIGYFLGGFIGTWSLSGTFWLQGLLLVVAALASLLLLAETIKPDQITAAKQRKFKLYDWAGMARMLTKPMSLFFIGVVLATFATVGYDNAFNFYIKKQLGFPPSANGLIKGSTGILGLIANLLINRWLLKHFDQNKVLPVVLWLCSGFLLIATQMVSVPMFIGANIIFYLFNAIYLPIQQSLAANQHVGNYGLLSGIFNSAKCIGMIAGSLSAGFLYDASPKWPFYAAILAFALAGLFSVLAHRFALQQNS